jgi:hypothetical protein
MKMVSVAWKLSMIEEWHQDQNCLFQQGHYRIKGHKPEKCSVFKVLVKMMGLGIIFSYDIPHYISEDQAHKTFLGNKD